jgi:hypothetical protein
MGACCGAAHHIYNNLGKPQPATSIDEHSGCQPQPAASMDGKGTCQTLVFYMTLVRHVPKCILSKNICFLSKNICFVHDLLMLGLMLGVMLGLMFPDAFFHFQHSCINRWKRHLPNINVLHDFGAACTQIHFTQIHMFFVRFIDVGIDVPGSFVQKQ